MRQATPPAPVPQIADPAARALWLAVRRGLLLICKEIERRCGVADSGAEDC
jgi:hypothetical protein